MCILITVCLERFQTKSTDVKIPRFESLVQISVAIFNYVRRSPAKNFPPYFLSVYRYSNYTLIVMKFYILQERCTDGVRVMSRVWSRVILHIHNCLL